MTNPTSVKLAILQALRDDVAERLRSVQASVAHTTAAATHDEARAEDKYDTRALEMTYLAAGQNARIAELRAILASLHFWKPPVEPLTVVAHGALVQAEADGVTVLYYIAPCAVGAKVQVDGMDVQVVSPQAPVGAALLGLRAGDTAKVPVAGRLREVEVLAVS
jgi:transcription elongation GreA/GreB family factor